MPRDAQTTQSEWQSATPKCHECQQPLTYNVERDEWTCAQHGAAWSGPALALSRGYTCSTCSGRGWHTAGGNDPMPCGRCEAGERWNEGVDD